MPDTKKTRKKKNTVESITEIAKQYKTRIEFARNEPAAYKAARRLAKEQGEHVFEQICSHMSEGQAKPTVWTWHSVYREAQKYLHIRDMRRNSPGAYAKMLKMGWKDKIAAEKGITWTGRKTKAPKVDVSLLDAVLAAQDYDNKARFRREKYDIFRAIEKKGWTDAVCHEMKQNRSFDSDEDVLAEARKYGSFAEFTKSDRSAHQIAMRRGLIEQIKALYDK